MKTIVITSQKGGSGKTTLAAHLSVEAERAGDAPAWLIDTDEQGTLSQWHERREHETPQRAEMPFTRLAEGLANMAARGAAYCFIDTAPTISAQSATIIKLADLVLIPVRPIACRPVGRLGNRRAGEGCGQAVSVRHHPSEITGHHYRADRGRPLPPWPCCPNFYR